MDTIVTQGATETTVSPEDLYKEVNQDTPGEAAKDDQVNPNPENKDGQNDQTKPGEGQTGDIKLEAFEGYLLDKSRVDDVVSFAKEHKMAQDIAEKILKRENEAVASVLEAREKAFEKQAREEWVQKIKDDQELGGDKFKETATYAHRALKAYGTEDLVKELNETGYGNHPELVRLLSRVGRAMADDKFINGQTSKPIKKSTEDIFYGKKE